MVRINVEVPVEVEANLEVNKPKVSADKVEIKADSDASSVDDDIKVNRIEVNEAQVDEGSDAISVVRVKVEVRMAHDTVGLEAISAGRLDDKDDMVVEGEAGIERISKARAHMDSDDELDDKLDVLDAFPSRDGTRVTAMGRGWMTMTLGRGLVGTVLAAEMSIECLFDLITFRWTGELGCLVCGRNLRKKENVKTHMRTIQEEKVRRRSPAPPAPSSVRALPRSRPPKIRSLAGPGVEAGGVPCPAPGQLDCPRSPDLACCDECYIVGMSRKLLKIHKSQHQ